MDNSFKVECYDVECYWFLLDKKQWAWEDKNQEWSVLLRKAREGKYGQLKTQDMKDGVEKLVSIMELNCLLFAY